jgi:hypothetical protein
LCLPLLSILNLYIQKDEIIKCIHKLKNNKAGMLS